MFLGLLIASEILGRLCQTELGYAVRYSVWLVYNQILHFISKDSRFPRFKVAYKNPHIRIPGFPVLKIVINT